MKSFEMQENFDRDVEQEAVDESISIEDPEEARDFIKNHLENGDCPVVTVPKEYSEALKTGLRAHSSWIPGVALIIGTLGREPFFPKNEERLALKIIKIAPDQVEPRFTGPDKKFHGVVVLNGPISPEAISLEREL